MKYTIGIDPGMKGGIAIFMGKRINYVIPMPTNGDLDVNHIVASLAVVTQLYKEQRGDGVTVTCWIEKVHSFPAQGVKGVWKFAFNTGILHGIIRTLGIPLQLVTPQAWKKEILAGTDKSKQAAIDYVMRKYPGVSLIPEGCRKPRDGMAEAICIAEYGVRYG